MKLPNGYGSVYKLSGKRRKPWGVRKTTGWDDQGKQKYDNIGYHETKTLALQALAKYNEDPYDIKSNSITFAEVYVKWSEEHFQKIVPSAARTWKSAYNYCKPLYDMRMKDLRVEHLEGTMKDAVVGDNTKGRMKSLFNLMYKYALRHEIVQKDYAQLCNAMKQVKPKIERVPHTDEEIQLLFDNISFPFVDMILIGIYSGWRPQELSILKIADIDLEELTMFGGLKTDAGRNRCVPIHDKIIDLVKNRYDPKNEYLFLDEVGQPMTYDKYRKRFINVNEKVNSKHRPHDTRHTFITKAKNANINEYMLKLMVGHAIVDVTEKVYTHRTIEQLKEEMNKIK